MILYANDITSRLQYIADFIGKEMTGERLQVTNDAERYRAYEGPRINYSNQRLIPGEVWIRPHGLLSESGIHPQTIECFDTGGNKAFFVTEGDHPFDIFAASFFLLCRYEEYLPHRKDSYGRFAHENALAFRENFLDQPLIDIWLLAFASLLKQNFPSWRPKKKEFVFLPTYDIDIAWSYLHKGWSRTAGGLIADFLRGRWAACGDRLRVLKGRVTDPYHSYNWLHQLHEKYRLQPYYFFLLAEKRGRYDKNISPRCKELTALVRDHAIRYPLGIHPSWRSGDEPLLLKKEIETLVVAAGSEVHSSRQHYIRFHLPDTFRILVEAGIEYDFSMGYGSINGFRASIANPFFWYDLVAEKQTSLLLFPFCYMEANSFYEQKFTAEKALEEMQHYFQVVKSVHGTFISIWHNQFLGTDPRFSGWKETYETFLKGITN